MKRIYKLFLFISLLIIATACYDDMGNYDYSSLPDVAITAKDTAYATQFKTLELSADINLMGDQKPTTSTVGESGRMISVVSINRKLSETPEI